MSTEGAERDAKHGEKAQYEIIASQNIVNLTIQKHGREVSIATDSQSALQLAADILTGVHSATHRN